MSVFEEHSLEGIDQIVEPVQYWVRSWTEPREPHSAATAEISRIVGATSIQDVIAIADGLQEHGNVEVFVETEDHALDSTSRMKTLRRLVRLTGQAPEGYGAAKPPRPSP